VSLEPYLTPYTKISSKWNKYFSARHKTIKGLEENKQKQLLDFGNDFLDIILKAQVTKAKKKKKRQD
jgi:hypothetical protein